MARKSKVWWWSARRCWACTIEGKRVTDKSGIPEDDVIGANQWYRSICGRDGVIPYGTHTVEDLCEEYTAWDAERVRNQERDRTAQRCMAFRLRRICRTTVKGIPLRDYRASYVTTECVDAANLAWQRLSGSTLPLKPSYRRELVSSLLTVFRWASRSRGGRMPLLASNPLAGYILPKTGAADEKFAERSEAAAWLRWLWRNNVSRDYVLLQRCLIHTGARPSEWTRATIGEINWQAKPLPILSRKEWKNSRKTGAVRRIYIPEKLCMPLKRLTEGKRKEDWIFVNNAGTPWINTTLSRATKIYRNRAAKEVASISEAGQNRLTCYRWRHTAASNLLMSGVDIATTAKLLGTSVEHVARTYGHLQDGHLAAAARRMTRPL